MVTNVIYVVSLDSTVDTEENNENVTEDRCTSVGYNQNVSNKAKQIFFVLD
jgi:hypothetical protein